MLRQWLCVSIGCGSMNQHTRSKGVQLQHPFYQCQFLNLVLHHSSLKYNHQDSSLFLGLIRLELKAGGLTFFSQGR